MQKKIRYLIGLYFACFAVFIILFIFFSRQVKMLFFVTGFIALNVFISSYKKNVQLPIEIEVLTLGIVLCTRFYGIKAGLVVGVVGGLLSSIFYGYISPFLIPMLIGNALVAVSAPFSAFLSITWAGIVLTVIKNLFVFLAYHFAFGYSIGKNISYSVSNILLNIVLFLNFAPFLVLFMD